jgi:tRNA (cytidine/uridine-2'-O-)-methyltransferase
MEIVLYQPQIPPNTGTIARLCAATDTRLHLVGPLGFSLEDRYLKRAGLDYWPHVKLEVWPSWEEYLERGVTGRLVLTSARQGVAYQEFSFAPGDVIVLGTETMGLPAKVLDAHEHQVRIPIWGQVRSLNLSCAAAVLLYEALRQTGELAARDRG